MEASAAMSVVHPACWESGVWTGADATSDKHLYMKILPNAPLKENVTLKYMKYFNIKIFVMCLAILALVCWFVLYFYYSCEKLVFVCSADSGVY